jgi:hypothetical protein
MQIWTEWIGPRPKDLGSVLIRGRCQKKGLKYQENSVQFNSSSSL